MIEIKNINAEHDVLIVEFTLWIVQGRNILGDSRDDRYLPRWYF